MERPSLKIGVFLGAISALPLLAISYLGNAIAGLPFVAFDLFDWLTRVLPGALITFGIDSMVGTLRTLGLSVSETAKLAEQLMALGIVIFLGALLGLLVTMFLRQDRTNTVRAGAFTAVPFFLLFLVAAVSLGFSGNILVVTAWLFALIAGWGVAVAWAIQRVSARSSVEGEVQPTDIDSSRRAVLLKLTGAAVALTAGAWVFGRIAGSESASLAQDSGAGQPLSSGDAATSGVPSSGAAQGAEIPATPSGRPPVAPGTRSEVTSNDDFYRIDINTRPPVIDGSTWQLEVAGLFQNARNLTIADLMSFPAITQPITIGCISNRVAGDLIGTSYWTGIRLRDLLEELQLEPEAGALALEAEDGFYETVSAEDMMDERTLLVYGMNGETLPVEHGFPLRIYIPNRYGMKQPKWIVRMEAIEAWRPGYWVERGWSREARPQIVSVIDNIATDAAENGRVPIGGIAWAGDRGIQKVEVRVDDGPWVEAQLRTPPLSNLTWVQWRYDWPTETGRHTFVVRATDGAGSLQTEELNDPHPDGATGYHMVNVAIG